MKHNGIIILLSIDYQLVINIQHAYIFIFLFLIFYLF